MRYIPYSGWSHIRDLGQLTLNLLSEMNGLTHLLVADDAESDQKRDDNEAERSGLDSEISMMVESEHPYEGIDCVMRSVWIFPSFVVNAD